VTVRRKLVLLLGVTAVAGGLVIGAAAYSVIRASTRERYVERLRSEADLLAAWIGSQPAPGDPQRWAHDWGARLDLRVSLIARDGRVVGDSSVSAERLPRLENHRDRPEVRRAADVGWGQNDRSSESTGERYFYLARRLDGDGPIGFVRVALPAWQVRQAERPSLALLLLLLLTAPFLVAAVAFFTVRHWARPLEQLSSLAGRVAAGDLELTAAADRDDEIGALGRAVARMQQALAGKGAEIEHERRLLRAVIAGMKEGLLLVDRERRVQLVNDALCRAGSLRADPVGRPVAEVIRHPVVLSAIEAVLQTGEPRTERMDDAPAARAYELHATPVRAGENGPPSAVALLFFDVTRLESLESVRREFVANVSHELRTPLTAMKAAVLTLLDGGVAGDERGRFLDSIHRNAERMSALVEDLTDLSLIETGAIRLEIGPVDLAALAREVVAQVAPRYAHMGVRARVEIPARFTLQADRRRLEQVLVNLVDNAMKFNRRDGEVWVRAGQERAHATIVVEDTGIGIAADDHEKVFRRFHRVDPAASRELGGTGLGLAIVRHLVQLHGWQIRVESELGRGSRFIIET